MVIFTEVVQQMDTDSIKWLCIPKADALERMKYLASGERRKC